MLEVSPTDFFLPLVYLVIFLGTVYRISNRYEKRERMHFRLGFIAKILGCIFFMAVYFLHFKIGDTFFYYDGASRIWNAISHEPLNGLQILGLNSGEHTLATSKYTLYIQYFNTPSEWLFTRISAVLNLLCFNNFFCLSICFAVFSFIGTWAMYRVFTKLYLGYENAFFATLFLIPSVTIWTSGLLKDSLCLGVIGLIVWATYQIMKAKNYRAFLIIPIGFYVLLIIKSYLAYTLLISLVLLVYARFMNRSNSRILLKRVVSLFVFTALLVLTIGISDLISITEKQVAFKESVNKVKGYHSEFIANQDIDDSKYTLGEIEYTTLGILKKAPTALLTSLVRPYLWESRKLLILMMSLENLIFLALLLWVLVHHQFWKKPVTIWLNEEILFCFSYVILLGLVVGFTSYNFGILVRLKTPYMPFFGAGIVILYHLLSNNPNHIVNKQE